MASEPEFETLHEIWTDGDHYEVGPDRDGLDMIEIRYYDRNDLKCQNRLAFTEAQARLLYMALGKLFTT